MTWLTVLIRLVLSTILGGLVGIEREIHGRAAGLRTHILVSIGSTLFTIVSIGFVSEAVNETIHVDPSRIAAGIVTGIGFLGAGAIIRYGSSIKGLTTAASVWAVAAVGMAVGTGMYLAAFATSVITLIVLFLSRLEIKRGLKK